MLIEGYENAALALDITVGAFQKDVQNLQGYLMPMLKLPHFDE